MSALWITLILLLLAIALLVRSRGSLFAVSSQAAQERAEWAAEAGLQAALAELKKDSAWAAGIPDTALPTGYSRYRVPFGPDASVNNLGQDASTDCRRGPNTLPGRSALLLATGTTSGTSRTVEVLVTSRIDVDLNTAIAGSGRILLKDAVKIDGSVSVTDGSPVKAGLHSNFTGGPISVNWEGPNQCVVNGKISTVNPLESSIDLQGTSGVDYQVEQRQWNAPARTLPKLDLVGMIGREASLGSTTLNASGGSLHLTQAKTYSNGDQVIEGDLVLEEGAELYVNGSLKVNGSVSGKGLLVVKGQTTLFGDAGVGGGDQNYVSLLSHGSVELRGYNGTEGLDSLTSGDPQAQQALDGIRQSQAAMAAKLDEIASRPNGFQDMGVIGSADDHFLDDCSTVLCSDFAAHTTYGGFLPDSPGILRQRLASRTGPTAQFLDKKMKFLQGVFKQSWNQNAPPAWSAAMFTPDGEGYWDYTGRESVFDAVFSRGDATPYSADYLAMCRSLHQMVRQYNQDKLGQAYFKGMIYTNGAFFSGNEITVQGAVIANDDHTQPALTVPEGTFEPGCVALRSGCRLTFVKKMFEDGVANLRHAGALQVISWRIL